VNVSSESQLASALAAAIPGDHIVLADGSYSRFDVTRSGTEADPIVIRAANILNATASGFDVDADNVVAYGLDSTAGVSVGGGSRAAGFRLWRCRVRNGSGFAIRLFTAPDFDAAYCEVSSWQGRGFGFSAADSPRPVWRHSIFRDSVGSSSGNDGEAMHYSFGPPSAHGGGLVYRCKFKNWSYPDEGEVISVKCSGNTFRQITVEDCEAQAINNRFGRNNVYDAIWTDGSMGIGVHDGCGSDGNLVLGCRVDNPTGPSPGIMVRAGQDPPCTDIRGGRNAAAGECTVSGCVGTLRIGRTYSNSVERARGTRVREHTGDIIMGLETLTDSQPDVAETLHTWSPLIWLRDSDVGPLADL
jgi:hypothetical protein